MRALWWRDFGRAGRWTGLACAGAVCTPRVGQDRSSSVSWARAMLRVAQDFAALGIELKTVPVDHDWSARINRGLQIDSHRDRRRILGDEYLRQKLSQVLWVGWKSPATLTPSAIAKSWRSVVDALARRASLCCARISSCSCAAISGAPRRRHYRHQGQVLQVRPKGRNAADRRRAFGPAGEPTQIGKCGFYLRPAFVARILRGK